MRIFLFIAGLVAAGFLAYRYVPQTAQTIENQVTENVTAALLPNNLPADVQIKVDGRDVALSGVVLKPTDKENFVNLSQGAHGVRGVQDNLVIAEAPLEGVTATGDANIDVIDEPIVNEDIALIDVEAEIEDVETPPVVEVPEIDLAVEQAEAPAQVEIAAPDLTDLQEATEEEALEITQEEVIVMEDEAKKESIACQSAIAGLVEGKRVTFTSGQSKIKRESLVLLNDIAREMRGCSDIALHINGHTDNVGDATLNRKLSHKRAKSVGLYLLRQGVTQRVKIFGHGADQPIADNDTEAGRMANRRIEFNVKDAQASAANDNAKTDRSVFTTRSLRDAAIIER